MATAITTTASRIIDKAHLNAGLIQEGQTANANQQADGISRLNDVINFAQTQGLKLHLLRDVSLGIQAAKGLYTLMPGGDVDMVKPISVIDGYYKDSNGIQRPLIPMSWNEWVRLSQPSVQGQVNSYFVDKQYDRFNVNLWQIPDTNAATGDVHLILRVQATNISAITDDVVFPPEWFIYLQWALASELASGQPQEIITRCDQKASFYADAISAFDVEDTSVQFQVDSRMGNAQGDFR